MRTMLLLLLAATLCLPGPAAAGAPAPRNLYFPVAARWPGGPLWVTFEFSQTVRPGADPRELAVAFHSITFVDATAQALGTVTLGTPEANAQQGEGWFGNETQSGLGPFQWAGGPAKRATIRLTPPPRTAGILLHLQSIRDGQWMQVRLRGVLVVALPVEGRWHQGYIPLTGPLPAPAPQSGPQWTAGSYFPSFSASSPLYAIHVNTALADWWQLASSPSWRINSSLDTMMGLTLVGMQGLINRTGAAVFFDWRARGDSPERGPSGSPSPDGYWLERLSAHVPVVELDLDGVSAFHFLYQRYAGRFLGAVVYDPQVPDTINLATMYAGLEDRVMLAPGQLTLVGMPSFPSTTDLRTLAAQQGWDTSEGGKHRLYQWVYQNLWPRLEHRIIGVISPGPPTSRQIGDTSGRWYPLGLASRDYLVALRLPALWLSPLEEPQSGLLAQFVSSAPAPSPLLGFFGNDEEGTVALASRYGGWCPAFTNGNSPLSAGNLTVLGGVRPALRRYPAEINEDRLLATLDQDPVLTLWSSDGDSTIFQMDRGFIGGVNFRWDAAQGHRFGWTTNPTLADLAPIVWNDYVDTRREISLVSGFSGAGYMYPVLMSDAQLHNYLTYAARYLQATGLRCSTWTHVSARSATFWTAA